MTAWLYSASGSIVSLSLSGGSLLLVASKQMLAVVSQFIPQSLSRRRLFFAMHY